MKRRRWQSPLVLLLALPSPIVAAAIGPGRCLLPVALEVGINPQSVAVGDFNRDGFLDLAVANNGDDTLSVLLNLGGGRFGDATSYAVGNSPYWVIVGDFNGDGSADLVVANYASDALSVLFGDGDGRFAAASNVPAGDQANFVAAGDFNGDGLSDLAVTNFSDDTVSVLMATGGGHFRSPRRFAVGRGPHSVAVGDFNADTHLDLAVANNLEHTVSILAGIGDGGFSIATPYRVGARPFFLSIADFDDDAHLDLAVANSGDSTVSILLGTDSGFTAATRLAACCFPVSLVTTDLNGDRQVDLASVGYDNSGGWVWLGTGSGSFGRSASIAVQGAGPVSIVSGDLDGDHHPDLAVASFDDNTVSVLLGCFSVPDITPTPTPLGSATPTPTLGCVGDCAGTGDVTVSNLLTMVNIALGRTPVSACTKGIPSGIFVTINVVVSAVYNALTGCNGTTPRFSDNGDGTVTDNLTHLMWEKKSGIVGAAGSSNPDDVNNIYSLSAACYEPPCPGKGSADDGTAFTDFLPRLNGALCPLSPCSPLGGHIDWRLPALSELETIVDMTSAECYASGGCIAPVFGPTQPDVYWSTTSIPDNAQAAFALTFVSGYRTTQYRTSSMYVRAVRGGS